MPDLLIELFSEEIPARMQRKAAEDLKSLVTNALVEGGVTYDGAKGFATPRRLALSVHGLPARQPDRREEKKGPRVGAPDGAIQGFLKSAGLTSLDQAKIEKDPKKGEFYVAVTEIKGRPTIDLLAEILPGIVKSFPWPKSMRSGAASTSTASLRWVRPLHAIVATFGPETEDPETVHFSVDGIAAGATTHGHRFMAPGAIHVRRLDDYRANLEKAKVVLDADRRREIILSDARNLAFAAGLDLVEDEGLLEEVAGLVEWPVVLMGAFDPAFLELPGEVIRATIRANQKCFVLRDPATGSLAPKFLLVANIEAKDGGQAIVAGNERVVRARLSDARHFFETDRKPLPGYEDQGKPLDQRMAKLRALNVVFHEKLGTQGERVDRIKALARHIAPLVGADPDLAERAAALAKADLMTEVVGEFPETQGLMGRKYAALQGEPESVAIAIEDHYKPQGPTDRVPTDKVAIAVALADKLDTLTGFWAIDEKPTGSKDPFALRRAALGVIRIILENGLNFSVDPINDAQVLRHQIGTSPSAPEALDRILAAIATGGVFGKSARALVADAKSVAPSWLPLIENHDPSISDDLRSFLQDRLKIHLRDSGIRHDIIDAVIGPESCNLLLVVRRAEALARFLDTEDGKQLLAGVKRASNILRDEEKKDGAGAFDQPADLHLLKEPEEQALFTAVTGAESEAEVAVGKEDYDGAMKVLAALRPSVDAFFEAVRVNAEDPAIRANRLRLLAQLRKVTRTIADFSKIGG